MTLINHGKKWGLGLVLLVVFILLPFANTESTNLENSLLADSWPTRITQWEAEIVAAGEEFNLNPDLIASIILAESNGDSGATSYVGAVGLMGIMPKGNGFEYRPHAKELYDPATNIRWGCAILADILQQSSGDIHASLAAYNGGWQYATYPVPKNYANDVLHHYGRAIASNHGIDPNIAVQWTIGIEIKNGYIANNELLAGSQTLSPDLPRYEGTPFYSIADDLDRAYHVNTYAVPLQEEITADDSYVKLAVH